MGSSYSIDADADPLEIRLVGRLQYETIAAMLEELDGLAATALPALLRVLVDETAAQPGLLGIGDVRRWSRRWRESVVKDSRVAVVAPSLVMFGLNRMAHGLIGAEAHGHLAAFRDRAEAVEWLSGG